MYQDRRGYWYRSKRVGARVVREYIGTGAWWKDAANLEAYDRSEAAREKHQSRDQWDAIDAQIETFSGACDSAMRAALKANGYHQHARGQWRKRRHENQENHTMKKAITKAKSSDQDELRALTMKAQSDPTAAKELFDICEENGTIDNVLEISSMAARAQQTLIESYAKTDTFVREAENRRFEKLCRKLEGPNPTPLEVILARRVAMCDFQVSLLEALLAGTASSAATALYLDKRLDKAHKRLLAAGKALAQVRKLQLPTVQVNIGEKQVNVANVHQINAGE